MILDKFIEIHSELQYCILTMDVGSQEDRTKFSKLYFQLYSLFLISDKLEKYCNNLSELQEMLTDPFCDDDVIEEKIEVILSSIDEQYVDVVDRLAEGEKNSMNGNIEGYSIMQCYKLLYDFCASMELSEESYCDLLHNLYAFEIAINADLFGKIIGFCEKVIEPEIDRNLEIDFTIEEAEEIDGVINIKTQEAEKKFDMLLDIQEIIAKGKGPGYERWAKVHNIKQISQILIFLRDHNIRDMDELAKLASESSTKFTELSQKIKDAEKRMAEIAVLKTHIINYSKTKDVYVAYRKAGYSKQFFEAHREEILLHKAAKEAFGQLEGGIPKIKDLNQEYAELLQKKKEAYAEYRMIKEENKELQMAKHNLERFLNQQEEEQKEKEKQHNKSGQSL